MTIELLWRNEPKWFPKPDLIEIPPYGFVKYLDHMGSDETIVEAARTSTGKGFISWDPYLRCEKCGLWGTHESMGRIGPHVNNKPCSAGGLSREHSIKEFPRGDNGLLEYMYKNKHETPAEMPVYRVLIKAPIFYWRQRHRHRAASYNEQSARYMQLPNDFYLPRPEDVKGKSATNKQGSAGELPPEVVGDFRSQLNLDQQRLYKEYEEAISKGVAPEMARINLPVSIYSVGIVQVNLRMGLHHLGLRDDAHAQSLTQEYARAEAAFVQALYPRWYALYEEYTKFATKLSRTEHVLLKKMFASLPNDTTDYWGAEERALYKRLTS